MSDGLKKAVRKLETLMNGQNINLLDALDQVTYTSDITDDESEELLNMFTNASYNPEAS